MGTIVKDKKIDSRIVQTNENLAKYGMMWCEKCGKIVSVDFHIHK